MAVTVKTHGEASARDLLAVYQKKHGTNIGLFGGFPQEVERIPTGVFAFDLATGGGIPRGRCTIIYGPESSGKTNLCLLAIRSDQRLRPDKIQVFIAIEAFDPVWAKKMGVDVERILVMSPGTAEEAADMAENMLKASDVSMVVLDSLAAMVPLAEVEKGAEGQTMGGSSNPIGKMVRLTTLAQRQNQMAERDTTLIYVNQTRSKVGFVMGDPETMPGGNAPKFQAALWVRVYGKNVKDPKITDKFPIRKDTKFVIKKNKVPIVEDSGQFDLVTYPHNGLRIGDTDDWTSVKEYLEHFGLWINHGGAKGYEIVGAPYKTQAQFKDRLYADRKFGAEIREALIERTLEEKEGQLILQNDPKLDGVGVDADGVVASPPAPAVKGLQPKATKPPVNEGKVNFLKKLQIKKPSA